MAGDDEYFGSEFDEMWLMIFICNPNPMTTHHDTYMDQMILSEPPIIIIWTYQDMMEWMSRILIGGMAGADEDFGSEVGQTWVMIFICIPNISWTLHDPHGPDDPFRTTNYHHLVISGHDGMDEQDIIGWRNG
jgi:hypothetical protein